ncbi:MAG TPA: T9SS type A sorting domain-containing protein [Candidatus Kapabacteria bacterium]|nr:T9SS type A sorting domain-containing protein [Candidatus Kapabacteria bacterium]HPO61765.1 T9SS type A sorting domain-containing protein [Candidatus Kapabacteria bacterium]
MKRIYYVLYCLLILTICSIEASASATAWGWGRNSSGQIGNNSLEDLKKLVRIGKNDIWFKISCGNEHTVAIRTDGTLWAWGNNKDGQLGDGTQIDEIEPVQIGMDTDWLEVECGFSHTLAIKTNGTLWAWGYNNKGQLGDNTNVTKLFPFKLSNDKWKAIACGSYYSVALKADGTLWAWGDNNYGQLGVGNWINTTYPVKIGNEVNWEKIDCGYNHTLALKKDSTLWSWGYNNYGQLGVGSRLDSNYPVQVDTSTSWEQISCGGNHSMGIRGNKYLFSWGNNDNGQTSTPYYSIKVNPIRVRTDINDKRQWKFVACGGNNSIAIRDDGTLWICGDNSFGQLINAGTKAYSGDFIQIGIDDNWKTVSCGSLHFLCLKSITYVMKPNLISLTNNEKGTKLDVELKWQPVKGAVNYDLQVSKTENFSDLEFDINEIYDTLFNINNLEFGTKYFWRVRAVNVDYKSIWSDIWCFTTIEKSGQRVLWATGAEPSGLLGDTSKISKFYFKQITEEYNWQSIICTDEANVALKSDGTLWVWSYKSNIPQKISEDVDWKKTSGTDKYCFLLKNDGTIWASYSTKIKKIFNENDWIDIEGISYTCYALKNDYTLWKFYFEYYDTQEPVPFQIGQSNEWSSISARTHCLALKKDGTLWAWGNNSYGQLGNGTTEDIEEPFQIGNDNNWASVHCGYYFSMALKKDGSLWAWGSNSYGQLGDGTRINSPKPIRIGADNDWKSISCRENHVLAIKQDSTLWGWGYNGDYQFGDGSQINKFVPTQLGTSNNWISASGGAYHSAALALPGNSNTIELLYPEDYTTNEKIDLTFIWKSVANAEFYTVQIATDIKFDSIIFNKSNLIDTFYNILELNYNTKYFWRVLAEKNGQSFAQSKIGHFKTIFDYPKRTLWLWGANNYGQMGDSTVTHFLKPTMLGEQGEWSYVESDYFHNAAIKSDGSLWGWGQSQNNPLSSVFNSIKKIPYRFLNEKSSDWISVNCGVESIIARNSDGCILEFNKDFVNSFKEEYIGNFNHFVEVKTQIISGAHHNLFVKSDGTLWGWGIGNYGRIGDGTENNRANIIQIGSDSDWESVGCGVYQSYGIKNDGSLWSWGFNNDGILGYSYQELTPKKIGNENDWAFIDSDWYHTLAIKSDGTLWAWGQNLYGKFGNGNYEPSNFPVKVGNENNWSYVKCCNHHTLAIKSDGTVWGWGANLQGQLADSVTPEFLVPKQISESNEWVSISCGLYHSLGLTEENGFKPPILQTPFNNSLKMPINKILRWNPVSGTKSFTLELSLYPDFSSICFSKSGIVSTCFKITDLEFGTRYFWRVNANNGSNTTDWSEIWCFKTTDISDIKENPVIADDLFEVFPNPAVNEIIIKYPNLKANTIVKIYNLLGEQVFEKSISNETSLIEINSIPKGAYILVIDNKSKAFIKE